MNREQCFKNLIWLEYTDHLNDRERLDYIERYYKKEFNISELDFSDRVYLENVFNDYKGRKKRNQELYFKAFENNFTY